MLNKAILFCGTVLFVCLFYLFYRESRPQTDYGDYVPIDMAGNYVPDLVDLSEETDWDKVKAGDLSGMAGVTGGQPVHLLPGLTPIKDEAGNTGSNLKTINGEDIHKCLARFHDSGWSAASGFRRPEYFTRAGIPVTKLNYIYVNLGWRSPVGLDQEGEDNTTAAPTDFTRGDWGELFILFLDEKSIRTFPVAYPQNPGNGSEIVFDPKSDAPNPTEYSIRGDIAEYYNNDPNKGYAPVPYLINQTTGFVVMWGDWVTINIDLPPDQLIGEVAGYFAQCLRAEWANNAKGAIYNPETRALDFQRTIWPDHPGKHPLPEGPIGYHQKILAVTLW